VHSALQQWVILHYMIATVNYMTSRAERDIWRTFFLSVFIDFSQSSVDEALVRVLRRGEFIGEKNWQMQNLELNTLERK